MDDRHSFDAELKAQEALLQLMQDAKEVARLFKAAGLDTPNPLERLFGTTEKRTRGRGHQQFDISSFEPPNKPAEAQADWIWVDVPELTTATLALAVLREAGGGPMTASRICDSASRYQPNLNRTSLMNVGPRLDGKVIKRTPEGWILDDPTKAALIFEARAWGPIDVFLMQDITSFRRSIIRHILQALPSGLMAMQILDQLKKFDYYKFPLNKELVQDDLEAMQTQTAVKRIGNSRKWTLTKDEQ